MASSKPEPRPVAEPNPIEQAIERELRKRRRHSAQQLLNRPVTLDTCSGPVTIQTREDGAKIEVLIFHPGEVPVSQPKGGEPSVT